MTDFTRGRTGSRGGARGSGSRHGRGNGKESPQSAKRNGWILFIGICVALFSVYLIATLYDLQVNQYEYYSKLASQQHWKRIEDIPERGDILDANGNTLASTTYVYTVGITPSDVRSLTKKIDSAEIADHFASALGIDIGTVTEALAKTDATYVQLAKNISKDQIDTLRKYLNENDIGGTTIDSVPKRYYTNGSLASQILGYATPTDGLLIGQLGIESQYNTVLTGKEGYTYVEVDNYTGSALPYSAPTAIEAQDGYNVVLNIDQTIQEIAEKACEDVYDVYDVMDGVTAIVMDPYTGAVLGMASCPDFDPNNPMADPDWVDPGVWNAMTEEEQTKYIISNAWRNRAISDTYEPGSTFKALTTAIALEEGLTSEDELFSDAPIDSGDYTIRCWRQNEGGNHGVETLKQAFENSCNPIFVQLAERIGIDKFYEYIHNFGFYDVTGIDLPAEGVGIFHKDPTLIDMQTLSFGESSTVTPLQLANAYCAIVNGGTLMTPQIAKSLTDQDGNVVKNFEPETIRTIFSESTARRVRSLMEAVVTEGTGTAGYVEGYAVAGKTSTSTIETGSYAGLHVLSFGCYAPADDPEIVVLVVVNKPADKEVGSSCAARAAANIISQTLEYMGVERKYTADDYSKLTTLYSIPDVTGMTWKEARATLYLHAGAFTAVEGTDGMSDDTVITSQFPAEGTAVYKRGQAVLYAGGSSERKQAVIPDFTGKNIAECLREAEASGVNIIIEGDPTGTAVSQDPCSAFSQPAAVTPAETGQESLPADTGAGQTAENGTTEDTTQNPSSPLTKVEMGTIIRITMALEGA